MFLRTFRSPTWDLLCVSVPSQINFLFFLLIVSEVTVQTVESCSGRKVYNSTWGIVTDGTGKYPASAHCEWLIIANETGKFINLEFVSMQTECSYDYLFVYDGNSYNSPLLGSYSGETLPDRIIASSGYMLIYFYSDRNYVLNGFYAKYSITDCPYNCSNSGQCDTTSHACTCKHGSKGPACDVEVCPYMCGDHGECDMSVDECVCDPGYVGYDCSLAIDSSDGGSTWYNIAPQGTGFTPRTGHVGVFMEETNSLYIFGGYTLNTVLNDVMQYSFSRGKWIEVGKSDQWPSSRRQHAVAQYGYGFYVFGGILADGNHSSELWFYDVTKNIWSLRAAKSLIQPAGVASHTLTLVEGKWLYLFGGRTSDGHFLSDMYRLNVDDDSQWERVISKGGKEENRRLVGHSCVYHPESKSLLIFSGFLPDNARFPKRTNTLHAYHIEENYWSEIHYNALDLTEPPKDRAFHTAAIMGNYMVIYGGNTHIHNDEEICYDAKVYFYHLGCHRWVNPAVLEEVFPGGSDAVHKGRFSHVAVPAFGNTLLISGGYKGSVLGDLIAYTVPLPIAKNKNDTRFTKNQDSCYLYSEYDHCKEDPECIWCPERPGEDPTPGCIHRSKAQACLRRDIRWGSCPGLCAALTDCGSCTVQGQGASVTPASPPGLWQAGQCAWCVKESQCQKLEEQRGTCNASEGTLTGLDGWWGKNSSRPTHLHQCRLQDEPTGLHWLRYRFPPDFDHPDEVDIVRSASANLKFEHYFERENTERGEYTAKFRGFIHPLGAESSNGPPLKVWLVSVTAQSKLFMSPNENPDDVELVSEVGQASYGNQLAQRPDKSVPIFPHEKRGYKYYTEQIALQGIAGRGMTQVVSTMQLEWTGALKDPSRIRQVFSAEFLEPYSSGSCSGYDSCLACMSDVSCGWCPTNRTCHLRSNTAVGADKCGVSVDAHHLVLNPGECATCDDHVFCDVCTADPLCEWLTSDARCTRRGRFSDAVRKPHMCPAPCQQHSNCSSCVGNKNECAWCEEQRRCFPFVEYVMRYAYGGCTQWIDSMSNQECHDCSKHSKCGDCLADYQCGWCGNVDNPTKGRCLHGDFVGPGNGEVCSEAISQVHNISSEEPAEWSYGVCPDVEECRLELHDCHPNASCVNTFEHYECECNKGFMGDGHEKCERTCYYDCIQGSCSGAPDFQCECDIGWTGDECNTNCRCNNHSTCSTGIGKCDKCVDWTTGEYCESCKLGSYGDATSTGCKECECNGHADEKQGFCNTTTGQCYCTDNTKGPHCEFCEEGYYGDPRNGSKCYLRCEGRTILGSITSGALGTHRGAGVENKSRAYCLWILTVHQDLNNLRLLQTEPTITFTMETDIRTICSKEFVYVYDGIPSFITASEKSSATLLAAFCGYGLEQPVSVEAKSGYLTVYFEANIEQSGASKGFNATYHVNTCPNNCHGNRHCVGQKCVCKEGFVGMDCLIELCPLNCSQQLGSGQCNKDLGKCECEDGYGGEGCEYALNPNMGLYSQVYDPWRLPGHNPLNNSLARMGHTLLTCNGQDLIMFGGYSLSHGYLNDMWMFKPEESRWEVIEYSSDEIPSPRYFHAAVCVPVVHAVYVFGGLVEKTSNQERAVSEMWKFSLDSKRWTKLQIANKEIKEMTLPPLAGHTMTLVGDTELYIIGGMSVRNYYSEEVYMVDTASNKFKVIETTKNVHGTVENRMGAKPTGLYGHSAIYHGPSQAIYVYGGYEYQTDKNVESANLYAFDLKKDNWSLLPHERNNQPPERFFHAAVGNDDYMVVMGGRTRQHYFNNSVMVYRYSCNHWMDVSHSVDSMYEGGMRAVIGSSAAVLDNSDIYMMAGYDAMSHAELIKLQLPTDLCALFTDGATCLNASGCAFCVVHETNETFCYSNNDGARPAGCLIENTTVSIKQGVTCDAARIEDRDCNQHKKCSECLTHWPAHRGHDKVCQWCSNCPKGKCIPKDVNCEDANSCKRQQRVIKDGDQCVETLCQAANCENCWAKNSCIWTRQFKRSSEVGRTLSVVPIYDWNCVTKTLLDATPYIITSSPPNDCPKHCYEYKDCSSCLDNKGAEGGDQKCVWSVKLGECLPPAFLPLHCSNGECGYIIDVPNKGLCPPACDIHSQCSSAVSTPNCGWCAYGGLNGRGIAMTGGLMGPVDGTCDSTGVAYFEKPLPDFAGNWSQSATGPPMWAYGNCPEENECLNDHHTCEESESCTDLTHGFRCDCKPGYSRNAVGGRCTPVCTQGCANQGVCIEPNVCRCHFGYVGHNCTAQCECNGHSNCKSPDERDVCTSCQNNTMGSHCEFCKPLFVGDPRNFGECHSCRQFCNNHSDVCLSQMKKNLTYQYPLLPVDPENITRWLHHGPTDQESTICILCRNNTEGDRCEQCKDGFFRDEHQEKTVGCRKCQCNGHSNMCDKDTGRFCQCKNHTMTPTCGDNRKPDKKCWEIQCSLCADNFTGTPTDGHQCYRQMNVNDNYCFDVSNDSNCSAEPQPLGLGEAVFYHVQPKYLNVDIRIILDVTVGGVDLYFSRYDNTFVVDLDEKSYQHTIKIDQRYKTTGAPHLPSQDNRSRRSAPHASTITRPREALATHNNTVHDNTDSPDSDDDDDDDDDAKIYTIYDIQATDFVTFVTIRDPDAFLIARNIQHRLVITLPNTIHNLKISRFFMVLHGASEGVNGTQGNLVFHQDQPHINLFVFFSVFFSCFFLFLAMCVVIWKAKQAVDTQRNSRRHRMQLERMSSRPFGKCLVIMAYDEKLMELARPISPPPTASSLPKRSFSGGTLRHRGSGDTQTSREQQSQSYTVYPIAMEPTDDGVAMVGTALMQLPGGGDSPMQVALASSLISTRQLYTTVERHGHVKTSTSTIHVLQSRGSSTA